MAARADLIAATDCGLSCVAGGFHIDPWRPVERAVITHAHSDHATPGCGAYLASATGAGVLRERLGPGAAVTGVRFGETLAMGGVRVTLFPAGHILGSAQVRVEDGATGETWVVSGDYKTVPDRTCEPFEPVRCHVFITESTFGLPIYRWPDQGGVFGEINAWWRENAASARTSIVFAYALGKAQRVLGGIDASIGPIAVHGAVLRLNGAYGRAGVALPAAPLAAGRAALDLRGRGLVVAPPSALGTPWVRKFATGPAAGGVSAAFVSGWMRVRGARRRRAVDRGFVLSDHADWDGLLGTIRATGAERVGVTHGFKETLARWLRERGTEAFVLPTRYEGETGEEGEGDERTASGRVEPHDGAERCEPP